MFTGLVETIGTVTSLVSLDPSTSGGNGTSLTISNCATILGDANLGDSICVNGTCLTVTDLRSSKDSFKVGVAPETLRRTNLGSLKENSRVNLERAVLGSTRMGGHFVQGHVDTIATIASVTPDGNALTFRLAPREKEVLRYIVEKGYITLDGASLTVTNVDDTEGWFEVMLIAYTQERVVMASKKAGEEVNIEIDIVGKLVEKSVVGYFEGRGQESAPAMLEKIVGRIVDEKMKSRQLHDNLDFKSLDKNNVPCSNEPILASFNDNVVSTMVGPRVSSLGFVAGIAQGVEVEDGNDVHGNLDNWKKWMCCIKDFVVQTTYFTESPSNYTVSRWRFEDWQDSPTCTYP